MSKKVYEEKKQEKLKKKEEKKLQQRKKDLKRNLKIYSVALIVLVVVGYVVYLLLNSTKPEGEDLSRAVEIMGEDHIAPGSPTPEYNSNPPTSGPHYAQTAKAGYRTEEIPDEHIIHNLEHGDIWISYQPNISEEIKEALKQFDTGEVIITPREANDKDIALVAWGRIDKFDLENNELPIQRIADFIKRYVNKGPEAVPGKSQGV